MQANFHIAYAPLKRFEGGWCDEVGDSGGETYAGIARNYFSEWVGWLIIDEAKVHSSFQSGQKSFNKHLVTITGLSELVEEFYEQNWWDKMGLSSLPQTVANEIFEQAVNLGMGGSTRYLQRLCNAYNCDQQGRPYFTDLIVDGAMGKKTISALSILLEKRMEPAEIVDILNDLQCVHYINIAAKKPELRRFINGWMTRSV